MILKILGVIFLVIFILMTFLYWLLFIRKPKRKTFKVDISHDVKRAEEYPPPFPNGWFNLCSSDMVKKGQVIEVDALGKKLAVFRGEDGKIGVLDVYCPHLNANLADGCVKGNHLVCPFHAWEFETNGRCAKIPYSDKVPPHAKANSYTIKEDWGLILMWYHCDNEAPSWDTEGYLQELKEYKFHEKTSDVLRIHLQDFAENGADYAHFSVVHDLVTIPLVSKFIHVKHQTNIEFGEGKEKHMAYFTDLAELAWNHNNKLIPRAGGKATVTYYGPGFLVFAFETEIAKVLLVKTFTPLGELKVRMDDYIYAPKGTFPLAIKYILGEASTQFHDDIAIWERKNFATQPMLVKGDGPIMKMRAWYSQFYTDNSYKDKEAKAVKVAS